jgi:hypothetical protein
VAAFLRAGGHYRLNDADLAAAGRLHLVTARSSAAFLLLLLVSVGAWLLLARRPGATAERVPAAGPAAAVRRASE